MPPTNRVEHDSMGALEVPPNALWGAQTQRAVQKHAAAGAHAELGDLPPDPMASTEGGIRGAGSTA
jgi:aspartate ammonia-lyase